MKYLLSSLLLLGSAAALAAAPAPPRPDLLRFENGDQLHGAFQGIRDGAVVWQREDLAAPGQFQTKTIRKIILRGARPQVAAGGLAHVELVNGDRLPGTLVALDDKTVTVNTSFAGVLRLPRDCVSAIAPMPLGSPVRYYGPYAEDGWLMLHPAYPDGLPPLKPKPAAAVAAESSTEKAAAPAADEAGENAGENADEKAAEDIDPAAATEADLLDPDTIPRWDFSGTAWYWSHKKGCTPLARKSGMSECSVLRFDLAWRNRPLLGVVFHADFAHPPEVEAQPDDGADADNRRRRQRDLMGRLNMGDPTGLVPLFGNCYMLQINAGYIALLRCSLDAKGVAKIERMPLTKSDIRIGDGDSASFDLRCDRPKGTIVLQVNGERAMEWQEPTDPDDPDAVPEYAGKGAGFGFFTLADSSLLRVSEVAVADWNGNPDSARSMNVGDRDVVLLTNGTDRYSGNISGLADGKLQLTGKFGDFVFPLAEVAEIRFGRDSLSQAPEPAADSIGVRLEPHGRVSGKLLSGDAHSLRLATPFAGEIEVNLDGAVILDFDSSTNYLDNWDDPF